MWGIPFRPNKPPPGLGNLGGTPESFGIEPLVGFRSWNVVKSALTDGYVLKSIHMQYEWSVENEAHCTYNNNRKIKGHGVAPSLACTCGIYSQLDHRPLKEWENSRHGHISATGTIQMYGRIIRCQKGYKSQYARIMSPVILETVCNGDVHHAIKQCPNPPVYALPPGYRFANYRLTDTVCADHIPMAVKAHDKGGKDLLFDLRTQLTEVKRQLEIKYEGIEFLSWLDFEKEVEEWRT